MSFTLYLVEWKKMQLTGTGVNILQIINLPHPTLLFLEMVSQWQFSNDPTLMDIRQKELPVNWWLYLTKNAVIQGHPFPQKILKILLKVNTVATLIRLRIKNK